MRLWIIEAENSSPAASANRHFSVGPRHAADAARTLLQTFAQREQPVNPRLMCVHDSRCAARPQTLDVANIQRPLFQRRLVRHRLNARAQARHLAARCLLGEHAFLRRSREHGLRRLQGVLGGGLVSRLDRLFDLAHGAAGAR